MLATAQNPELGPARQRILYTGPLRPGSLTLSRLEALRDLGHDVMAVDQVPHLAMVAPWFEKAQTHLLIGPGIVTYNRELLTAARAHGPDIVFIDTGAYLWPRTLRALRATGATLVHYISEHFGHMRHFYRHFWRGVGEYDVHLVTHPLAKAALENRGASRVVKVEFGYDPRRHRPPTLTTEERVPYDTDAVFIGHWEPETERKIAALRAAGVGVRVWGSGWKQSALPDRATISRIPEAEYTKALAVSRLCLCFLSKWNQVDSAAGRTFEIPAVGGFLLAERTADHASYYREGVEAEFFGSAEELVQKAKHYLAQPDARAAIAHAGHVRCTTSGYRHHDRCEAMLKSVLEVRSRR